MPVMTVKEIGEICSIPPKNIHTYISRGKLVRRKDGLIDSTLEVNKDFIFKYTRDKYIQNEKPKKEKSEFIIKKHRRKKNEENNDIDESKYVDSSTLASLKAEYEREKIIKIRLENSQKKGEIIELKHAEILFNIHITSIIVMLRNFTENYTADLCSRLGSNRIVLAEFRGKLKKLLNDVSERAYKQSIKDLASAAEQSTEEVENE